MVASFSSIATALMTLRLTKELAQSLGVPITQHIRAHFLSNVETNNIEKPEWLFNYCLKCLSLIDTLLKLAFPDPDLAWDLFNSLFEAVISPATERIKADLDTLVRTEGNTLHFTHCLDEALAFEGKLSLKFGVVQPFIPQILTDLSLERWIDIDSSFALTQLRAIKSESPWEDSEIIEYSFSSLQTVQTLYETLALRYSQLMDEGLREEFFLNTEAILVPNFLENLEEKYQIWEGVIIQIEANKPLFVKQLRRLGALHQTAVKFQQFVLNLKSQEWADVHLRLNSLKRKVLESASRLLAYSMEESIDRQDNKYPLVFAKLLKYLRDCVAPDFQPVVLRYFEQEVAKKARLPKYGESVKNRLLPLYTDKSFLEP